jgi:hypothetical protein
MSFDPLHDRVNGQRRAVDLSVVGVNGRTTLIREAAIIEMVRPTPSPAPYGRKQLQRLATTDSLGHSRSNPVNGARRTARCSAGQDDAAIVSPRCSSLSTAPAEAADTSIGPGTFTRDHASLVSSASSRRDPLHSLRSDRPKRPPRVPDGCRHPSPCSPGASDATRGTVRVRLDCHLPR